MPEPQDAVAVPEAGRAVADAHRALPRPGDIVRVRSRRYLVADVVAPPGATEDYKVALACIDDDAQGESLEVLWEREVDARILGASSWSHLARRGFDPPRLFSAYLHTLRWNCVTSTNPKLFQSPFRAGIEVMAYQLEPLRKALLLPRVNLFIADDVGLGKTIEAGLIVRELLMRQKAHRIVVSCPPSVVLQWKDELETRFGLTFQVFDRAYVLRRRQERGYGVNPWETHARFIISHALLRDETYAGPLRDWLGDFSPGALLILDEAHNAAPASASRYAIDSHFTRVVRDIAHRFEHRLFLSATPHNGHSNSFSALCEILDPQRFCRGVPIEGARQLDPVMVRRLKGDLTDIGVPGFPKRSVEAVVIDGLSDDTPDLELPRLLERYARLREARLRDAPKSVRRSAELIVVSLQKRLLSSIEAFACTLAVHRRSVEKRLREGATGTKAPEPGRERQLTLLAEAPGADDDRADVPEDEVRAEEDAQMEAATAETVGLSPGHPAASIEAELRLLDRMAEIAEAARGRPDPRVDYLVDWIRRHLCPGLPSAEKPIAPGAPPPRWNDRRVIIFTEYADTKRYIEQQLRSAVADTDRADLRIATFHGGMGDAAREEVKRAFNQDPAKHPLRILIATDAAREGVNLQNCCYDLFHMDLPWNPSRIEQRNGRIDRKLQRAPDVTCRYFVFRQRPEDKVLDALVRKTETIRKELGSLSAVLHRRLTQALERGIRPDEADGLADAIGGEAAPAETRAAIDAELEDARERRAALQDQVDRLRDLLDDSKRHLGLDDEGAQLRDAISCSLEILGSDGIEPLSPAGGGSAPTRYRFPDLDRRPGADPTWAETLDTLRAPRGRDQSEHEWRRESPARPVVFKDTGRIETEVAHLHLEHRVVRRLLGRFLAQGFVHDDISRASVTLTNDPIPRVVLFGRLSLYGPRAARLHDEIILVAARWTPRDARAGALQPYAEDGESKTRAILEAALLSPRNGSVPASIVDPLRRSIERDVEELRPHLTQRGEAIARRAIEKLADRGEREAREMREILERQRERIQRMSAKYEDASGKQLVLAFKEDEQRQLEADRRHWQRRLEALAREMEEEPARIRAGYEVQATRTEPVGVVYLWPASG